ncbi:hypothetical protein CKAN_01756600 [Cinnamomum micranthum f. kanehirae]|uniref:Uncharacterized protein n=1 Tax=Cinnamomum micranthum f. kanehirae TaxID=337451 RepID=A0A3S3MRT0_9MAGN|nr:hypothetical protein CKAN_01756600 [Cinnamomum micranthum f. kanehirae]
MSFRDDEVATIKKEQESTDFRKAQQEQNARKVSEYVSLPSGLDLKLPKKHKGALETSFNVADKDIDDKAAARMFYACGLPFNLARSPYYINRLTGYTPPSFDRLHTTLLKQEKEHINRLVQPIKDTWRKKGLSLVPDGWSDLEDQCF